MDAAFGILLLCTEGKPVSQNDSLDCLKVDAETSVFTEQSKYYFKWYFLHWKCPGKIFDLNTHPVLRTHYCEELLFSYVWSSYVRTSFAILCSLLDVQTSCAYLNLLRNVQDTLGPHMAFSEEANLRNTTAGQPCRYVVSLGDPMKLTMHLWQWKQAQCTDCPPKHCHVLSRVIVALVIDKLYREIFEQFLFV